MGIRSLAKAGQLLGLVAATATMTVLGAGQASAEAPTNDTIDGATAITAVPFAEVVDTTEATTDAEDAAINTNCGAPATNGSVWYTLEADDSPAYVVDVSKSDFAAGVIVATGTPGNLTIVACGPQTVGFEATQGETYYLMAFSDNPDVVGGQLSIAVSETGPAPKVSMNVNDAGTVDTATGTATITGTYTCDGEADLVELFGTLQQQQDEAQVRGNFDLIDLQCGGTFDWSAEVTPDSGAFADGLAATVATTVGCNAIGCNFYDTLEVVRLGQ